MFITFIVVQLLDRFSIVVIYPVWGMCFCLTLDRVFAFGVYVQTNRPNMYSDSIQFNTNRSFQSSLRAMHAYKTESWWRTIMTNMWLKIEFVF